MQVVLYESETASAFGPLTVLRPVFELRCGVLTMREKLSLRRPDWRVVLAVRPELSDLVSEQYPHDLPASLDDGPTAFLSADVIVDDRLLAAMESLPSDCTFRYGDRVVGACVTGGAAELLERGLPDLASLGHDDAPGLPVRSVRYPWDIIAATSAEIAADLELLGGRGDIRGGVHKSVTMLSPENVTVAEGSEVAPGVVLDATGGDVVVGREARIGANSVLVGPVSVGDGSLVRPCSRIFPGTSIGPVCKVGGEISASVLQSHSNKQHYGYLGHSFIGSWVNLGAGTDTSDLRNDYGEVRVEIDGAVVQTGSLSVGAVVGDHTKTAIGTKLNTGSVVGVFCNVFPGVFPPKSLPSFSWGTGDGFVRHDLERAVETARRVMARRGVELSPAQEALIRSAHFEA